MQWVTGKGARVPWCTVLARPRRRGAYRVGVSRTPTQPVREYQPALDGLRAVSVALVLLFHGGMTWMTGGYVGVSVFFTLSGFLITGLLLAERDASGGISASRFYARRVRRLLPASVACLVAVSAAAAFGRFDGLPHLRRDILSSLFQVANWNALAGGSSYADLVAHSSGWIGPVDHFWSLAVEEQFYWLWPLVCAALLSRGSSSPLARRGVLSLAALGVAAAPVIAHVWGADAAYWATPARLGEILVGAGLAVMMHGRRWEWRWLRWLGAAGFAVVVWAAVSWPPGSGPAYSGWLGVFALASAAVIAGLQVPGALRTALSLRPVVYIGRISYGVYLYHWPVFALVDERSSGADGVLLFGVRIAITCSVAVASFHLLEQPIRRGRSSGRSVAAVTGLAVAAVAALALVAVPASVPAFSGTVDVPDTFPSTSSAPSTSATSGTTEVTASTSEVPAAPAAVLLLGDSTMVALSEGLAWWAAEHPEQMQVASLAAAGCGLVRGSTMDGDEDHAFDAGCVQKLQSDLPALLSARVPDVVAIMITLPDVVRRTWSTTEGQLTIDDPRYLERLEAAYRSAADSLIAVGVPHVAWVVPPIPNTLQPMDPDEWAAFVDVILRTAAEHPEVIDVVRLDQWLDAEGAAADQRPDGLHLSLDGAKEVAARYLAPLLVQIARR